MRILLVGDYPPDPRLGSTKVLIKLQEEFRALGHTCDLLLADALGRAPRNPYLRQAFGPVAAWSAVRRMFTTNGPYDVVDVASAEGLWIASLGRRTLRGAVVISRSNGLEHLNYRRMLDDAAEGLASKPWTRRLFHPIDNKFLWRHSPAGKFARKICPCAMAAKWSHPLGRSQS